MNIRDGGRDTALTLHLNLIDGRQVASQGGQSLDVACPSDGLPFAAIQRSGAGDIDPGDPGGAPGL